MKDNKSINNVQYYLWETDNTGKILPKRPIFRGSLQLAAQLMSVFSRHNISTLLESSVISELV